MSKASRIKRRSMVNKGKKEQAVSAISAYVKKHHRTMRGWSVERITFFVRHNIYAVGGVTSPQWRSGFGPEWIDGRLMRWNSIGGFHVSVKEKIGLQPLPGFLA